MWKFWLQIFFIFLIACVVCGGVVLYQLHIEKVFVLPALVFALLKSLATIIAVITAVAGIWAFSSEHCPNVKAIGAKMNEGKTLISLLVKNYSKTAIKDMIIRMVIFESKIKDGAESTIGDTTENWFSLMPAKQRFSVSPMGTEQIVVNLNHLPQSSMVNGSYTMEVFKNHVFILIYLEHRAPLLFRVFKEETILSYDRQHNEWFVASKHHSEMNKIFSKIFTYLKKDDLDGLIKAMEQNKVQRISDSIQKVKIDE